jgi:hypothetical protein
LKNIILIACLIISFNSCKKNSNNKVEINAKKINLEINKTKHILDDYPVTENMFYNTTSTEIGKVTSRANWFSNDQLTETLIFELYTDNHRMFTYHFLNKEVGRELKNLIHFDFEGQEVKQENEIENHYNDFIKTSKKIDQKCFTSLKGQKLGDSKEKILKQLGSPIEKETLNTIEKYTWGIPTNKTEMYLKKNKLIAIIIYRDLI